MDGHDQETAESYKKNGNVFYAEKDYIQALENYEKAIQFSQNYKDAWFNKGMCHKALNHIAQAKQAFEYALQLDPSYEKASYQLNQIKILELPAHIIFAIADIKLTPDGKVKILEFGRGIQSGFVGHDCLYPEEPIKKKLSDALLKTEKPPFINSELGINFSDDTKLPLFLKLIESSNKITVSSRKISDYKGIYGGSTTQAVNPDVLVMDNSPAWRLVSENKYLMHQLFINDSMLLAYRPRCQIYPLRYDTHLAENIKKSFPGTDTKYVLKVPDLSRGEGVIIVTAAELDITLQILFCDMSNEKQLSLLSDEIFLKLLQLGHSLSKAENKINTLYDQAQKWQKTNAGLFLVEEYCQSKLLEINTKQYDATMRVGFIITVDGGKPKFTPLCCYWKLPEKPLGEGDIRDQTISHIKSDKISSIKVSDIDQAIVYKQLNASMPQIFLNMLVLDMPQIIHQLKNSPDKSDQLQAKTLLFHYANALSTLHRSDEALALIKTAKEKTFKYYHEKGIIYFNQHKHEKAIQKFDKAIEKNSHSSSTFFRRAKAYVKTNDCESALSDFEKAKNLGFDQERVQFELKTLKK